MRIGIIYGAFALGLAASAFAQSPAIRSGADGVVNNASYAPAGLPNSSIAQGSIFAIFGDNLGPAALTQQPKYPLEKMLGGTSVKVTVGGTTVDAIPIYTLKTQVGAVLPSNTPVGTGQVTVTYNGQQSAPHSITVVPSSFGTFSLNQQGSGPGVVTDANYNVITLNNSAKPGQTIIIWGTGLGSIAGDDAAAPSAQDLTNIPVRVTIGGQTAPLVYRGRSGCCSGLDQVMVTVPAGVEGCYQSLIIRINDVVSNVTTIPVAPNGGACSDPNGFSGGDIAAWIGKGSVSFGSIVVGQSTTQSPAISVGGVTIPGQTTTSDDASAMFIRYDASQLIRSQGLLQQASFGSCIVNTYSASSTTRLDPVLPTFLNAGNVAMTLPAGNTIQLEREPRIGIYSVPMSGGQPPSFIGNGGTFRFTGSGGTDVGAFNTDVLIGTPLKWTNMDQITDVTRANGVRVEWTGGSPNTYVVIGGNSMYLPGGSAANATIVSFSCTAPVSAGNFTVPADVLLALPASSSSVGGVSIPTGSLSVTNMTNPKPFTASGLDFAFIAGSMSSGKTVNYK